MVVAPFMGLLPVYSLPSFAVCLRKETTMESREMLGGNVNKFCNAKIYE